MKPAARDYSTIDFPFEIKSLDDAGLLEGYAAVFGNEDKGGDVIEAGAFTKTIQENASRGVPVLYQHDPFEVIGLSTKLDEDRYGLAVKAQLNMDVQRAREARSLIIQGALPGLSIGYKAVKQVRVGSQRRLKELGLKEFSPTAFPMNTLATVSVKAMGDVIWDPEYGFNDLRDDISALLNPGPGACTFYVTDISLDQTHAIVQDWDANEAWVVPITVGPDGEPSVAPSADWVAAEQAWVASDDGKTFADALEEMKAGRMFSAANLTELRAAHEKISALLDLAEPPAGTPETDGAAGKALEPAFATLRDLTRSMKGVTEV